MSEHKPCPFCGSTTISHGGDDVWTGAWCEDCGAMGPNQYGKKEWNDRVGDADLAFYKGFHDGIYSTGTHVVVERKLLDECERALMAIDRDNDNPKRFSYRIADIVNTTLVKLRAQAKPK